MGLQVAFGIQRHTLHDAACTPLIAIGAGAETPRYNPQANICEAYADYGHQDEKAAYYQGGIENGACIHAKSNEK